MGMYFADGVTPCRRYWMVTSRRLNMLAMTRDHIYVTPSPSYRSRTIMVIVTVLRVVRIRSITMTDNLTKTLPRLLRFIGALMVILAVIVGVTIGVLL
jgi:hypothetical protein